MITDDAAMTQAGPHALARNASRMLALKSFGVDTIALEQIETQRSLARQSRHKRELMLQGDHSLIAPETDIFSQK